MNPQQETRVSKTLNQKFYLLDKKIQETKFTLSISGSTLNVYEITYIPSSRKFYCNCPDYRSHARTHGCVCKHCCFTVLKIFKNIINSERFFKTYVITDKENENILEKVDSLNITSMVSDSSELVDQYVLNKFKNIKFMDTNKDEIFKKMTDTKLLENDCPICYDTLNLKNVSCPGCHQIFHIECINLCLKNGQKCCPYCRNDIWSKYLNNTNIYPNLVY